ncbi:MAG: hypothetical protein CMH54_00205 [Myxococcales bacterium]|nr:hypothetical protein [Myxococcales bacterium]
MLIDRNQQISLFLTLIHRKGKQETSNNPCNLRVARSGNCAKLGQNQWFEGNKMSPFWDRRDHAMKRVKRAYLFVSLLLTGLFLLGYLTIRILSGLAIGAIGVVPGVLEILGVCIFFAGLSWRIIGRYRRISGRLALIGMGVETPNPKNPNHKRFLNMVEELSSALGVPCVEPMINDWMAINVCAVQTASGRVVLVCTDGALRRRTDRQLRAMVAHALGRTIQPEFFEMAATSIFFGAASQATGLKDRRGKSFQAPSIGSLRFLVPILALCWKMWRKPTAGEMDLAVDQLAADLTHDALALAEAIELTLLQWRGAKWLNPAFEQCVVMPLYLGHTERVGGQKANLRASSSVRVGKLVDTVMEASAPVFQGRASVDAQRNDVKQGFYVMRKQAIEGPFLPDEIATRGWLTQQSLVRATEDSGLPTFASKIGSFAAVFEKREDGCPRCSIPLSVITYGEHSLRHCGRCRGYAVGDPTLNSLSLERHSNMSPAFRKNVRLSVIKEAQALEENKAASRIYMDVQCPSCSTGMTNLPLDVTSDAVIWRCDTCALNWFDAHELPCLDIGMKRETVTWVEEEVLVRKERPEEIFEEEKKFDTRLMGGSAEVGKMAEDLLDAKLRTSIGHLGPEEEPSLAPEPEPVRSYESESVPRIRLKEESVPLDSQPKETRVEPQPVQSEEPVEPSVEEKPRKASPTASSARARYPGGTSEPQPKPEKQAPTEQPAAGSARARYSGGSPESQPKPEAPAASEQPAAGSARSRYPNPDQQGVSRPRWTPPPSDTKDTGPHWFDGEEKNEEKPKKKSSLISAPFVAGDAQEARRRRLIRERQAKIRKDPEEESKDPGEPDKD